MQLGDIKSVTAAQIFKRLKRKIRRHSVYDLLDGLQTLLFQPDATNIEYMARVEYWHLLLLFKWVLQYGDYERTNEKPPVTEVEFVDLLNDMKNLSDKVFLIRTEVDRFLFFRSMCYQQFWVQRFEKVAFGLVRQYAMFANLEEDHTLQKTFMESFGISLDDFIELSLALFSVMEDRPKELTSHSFSIVQHAYGLETIESFLASVSIRFHEIPNWLRALQKERGSNYRDFRDEFHEQSPFLRFPLLRAPNSFICVSPRLLQVSASSSVFDMLGEINKDAFMGRFGNLFERYVEDSLRVSSCQFLTERALLKHIGGNEGRKVVDFLIVDNCNNILIETKGVAMPWRGMVAKRPGTVRNASKSSLVKGIEQAYDFVSRLADVESIGSTLLGTKETYLLIVTFKDMFVGNGETFRNFIAPDEIDKIIREAGGKERISLSNIIFISVDELDMMLGSIASGSHSFSDFLEHARERQSMTLSKVYGFRDNILDVSGHGNIMASPLLNAAREELFDRVRCKMSA